MKTIEVHSAADIGSAFQNLMSERVLIPFVAPDDVCHSSPADRCLRIVVAWLPNVFYLRENVEAGGLVSYGINLTAMYHRAACLLRGQDTEGRKAR